MGETYLSGPIENHSSNKGNELDPVTEEDTSDTSSGSELGAIAEEAEEFRNEQPVSELKAKKKKRKFFRLPFKRKKTKKVAGEEDHIEAEPKKTPDRRESSRYYC